MDMVERAHPSSDPPAVADESIPKIVVSSALAVNRVLHSGILATIGISVGVVAEVLGHAVPSPVIAGGGIRRCRRRPGNDRSSRLSPKAARKTRSGQLADGGRRPLGLLLDPPRVALGADQFSSDLRNRCVWATGVPPVTDGDLARYQMALEAHPNHGASFDQLVDLRAWRSGVDVTDEGVKLAGRLTKVDEEHLTGTKLVIVVSTLAAFGVARTFSSYAAD